MNNSIVFWVITIFIGFALQITLSGTIDIVGVFPNILLLATIFFSVRGGPVIGELTGFIWGLFCDITSLSLFGSQCFMFTIIGYMVGHLHGKIDERMMTAQIVVVFLMSVFYLLGLLFFEYLFEGIPQRFHIGMTFLQPVYTTLACPILFLFLSWWYVLFHRTPGKIRLAGYMQ